MNNAVKANFTAAKVDRLAAIMGEALGYFLVSVGALGLDYSLLVGLTELGHLNYLISAACGFAAGLALSYLMSAAFVFREHRLASRQVEFIIFAIIGLVGLALNEGLMKLFVDVGGMHYAIAKIPAAGIGFIFNFGARRLLLFTNWESRLGSKNLNAIHCPESVRPRTFS
jgi:putative flippase GtrA